MKKILTASQMQSCDKNTIEEHNVPSLVLMERAALSVVVAILANYPEAESFNIICGPGNNGGDGIAVGRLLKLKGKKVVCTILGDENKFSQQLKEEIAIAKSYNLEISNQINGSLIENSDLIIDAMFGIGLTRGLSGDFEKAASLIKETDKRVVAVDIPSGYDADSGKLLGDIGVKADLTVTMAYMKKGLVLGDCKEAAGKIQVADVGIYLGDETLKNEKIANVIDEGIFSLLPPRKSTANKGSCGKLLIIAGSENIYGACYLAAKTAIATGTGLVKIFTHKNNINSLQQNIPEAMYFGYENYDEQELLNSIAWADTVLIGPGLGISEISEDILKTTLKHANNEIVIDADGINLVAKNIDLLKDCCERNTVILTPHLKEMERLSGVKVSDINYNMEKTAKDFVEKYNCTLVLKNFTTIVADVNILNYCINGNEALATPGSGDVLAGIISSFIAQNISTDIAVNLGVYLHALAGQRISKQIGTRALLASDIIEEIRSMKEI